MLYRLLPGQVAPNVVATATFYEDDDDEVMQYDFPAKDSLPEEEDDYPEYAIVNVSAANEQAEAAAYLPTVPIHLGVPGTKSFVKTNALIDTGSTTTLITADLVERLGAPGIKFPLTLMGISDVAAVARDSKLVYLEVRRQGGQRSEGTITAKVVPSVLSDLRAINWNDHKVHFDHLVALRFPIPEDEGRVEILLGNDNGYLTAELTASLLGATHPETDPIVRTYRIGKAVTGPLRPGQSDRDYWDRRHAQAEEKILLARATAGQTPAKDEKEIFSLFRSPASSSDGR